MNRREKDEFCATFSQPLVTAQMRDTRLSARGPNAAVSNMHGGPTGSVDLHIDAAGVRYWGGWVKEERRDRSDVNP